METIKLLFSLTVILFSLFVSAILLIPCLLLSILIDYQIDFHREFHEWWYEKVLSKL